MTSGNDDLFKLALQHQQKGRFAEAEGLYRQIISRQPDHADALHMLAIIQRKRGDNAAAIELLRRAVAADPVCENANFNLANALRDNGQLNEAVEAYRDSIAILQNVHPAYHNLSLVLKSLGREAEAEVALQQAQSAAGAPPQQDQAIGWFTRGNELGAQGRFAEATAAFRRAISLNPNFAEAYSNLGNALVEEKQLDDAIGSYLRSIEINPELPQAFHNLGKAYYDKGLLDEAIAANRRAVNLRPNHREAIRSLANTLFEAGRLDESIDLLRRSLQLNSFDNWALHSDLIYKLYFHPTSTGGSIAEETKRWNQAYGLAKAGKIEPHLGTVPNSREPDRRLRIGYVSPDFRHHVVGMNLLPLFRRHDHDAFEVICYSQTARPDSMTQWFQQHADRWRDIATWSDDRLCEQIKQDQVDILIDLALHTSENRLVSFARKPAPVQVSFAGYPGSTGLTAIDYRLSDPYLDPAGVDESIFSEKTIRLPNSFWCYDPNEGSAIQVGELPAFKSGIVTFGCLNNFCKINNTTLDLWSRVMQEVKESRLILLAKQGSHRQALLDYLANKGIDPRRIEFVSYLPRPDYLRQYHKIDIGLDTFPYNGHTTSLDSLWMGVPVVTLVGQTTVSRAGWCQLSNLGLTELAANSPDQFVQIAVGLANDLPKIADLRSTLRSRMQQSPLMDEIGFARSIEASYRQMWQNWCGSKAG